MTCLFCKYEFCYYCGAFAGSDYEHFRGLAGCGAPTYGDAPKSMCGRLLFKLGMFLLGLILFPIVLVLGAPLFFTAGWFYVLFMSGNPALIACACLLFPIPFAIGLIADVIIIPLAIILVPSIMVYGVVKHLVKGLSNRKEAKAAAMRRIQDIITKNQKLVNGL